ncbi:MAG: hypothetical protein JWN04_6637 [Myxococcaceae bacterium]|nr:hypothetical protein [Myxococcaceae bacterium]
MRRLSLLILLLLSCSTDKVQSEPASEAAPSAATRWVPVQRAEGLAWLEGQARVIAAPNASAMVSAPLTARVLRVRVRPGQHVKAGEPLVEVVMPELMRAAGMLRAADIRLASFQQRHGRLLPLLGQGLARASEVADLDASIASARADRESARATLRSAGESDARAAVLVEGSGTSALRAPLKGMVVAVSAQLGQVRDPASGPLVEIVGENAVQVEARFTIDPPAGCAFEWMEVGRRAPLVLVAVSPRAGIDGTRLAWLHTEQGSEALVAGTLGRVRMVAPQEWMVVPVGSLRSNSKRVSAVVRTELGNTLSPVTVVRRSQSEAVIIGLAAGTMIAADASRIAGGPTGELAP